MCAVEGNYQQAVQICKMHAVKCSFELIAWVYRFEQNL